MIRIVNNIVHYRMYKIIAIVSIVTIVQIIIRALLSYM